MKKFFLLSLILNLSICVLDSYAHYGWYWQNPLPQGNSLRSLQFVNSSIGYVSGDCGTILKTTDAGINWTVQSTLSRVNLYGLYFLNDMRGFAVGDSGTILYSKNGGLVWKVLNSGTNQNLKDIFFVSSAVGIAVGYRVILRTTNGGITWLNIPSTNDEWYSVCFANSQTGFAAGTGGVIKSTDSGVTWSVVLDGNIFKSVFFLDENRGYAVGDWAAIMFTTDGGANWVQQRPYAFSTFDLFDVHFQNQNTGFVTGFEWNFTASLFIFKTTNGGANWESWSDYTQMAMLSIYPADSSTVVSVGSAGKILKTTNDGSSWYETSGLTDYQTLQDITALDSNVWIAAGGSPSLWGGVIMRSTDAGKQWTIWQTGSVLYSLAATSPTTCTVVGLNGTILKTTNAGENWFNQFSPSYSRLESVSFINMNTGMAVGPYAFSSYLIKTNDGGDNWVELDIGNNSMNVVAMCTESVAYLAGDDILKTTDGGNTWYTQYTGYTDYLAGIYFLDEFTGYVVGGNGRILKTTNGGIKWYSINGGTTAALAYVSFSDPEHGTIVGENATILRTTDAGDTWERQLAPTNEFLSAVHFINPEVGTIVGPGQTILHTTNGGNMSGYRSLETVLPGKYFLAQNFPNPFNPVTKIRFSLPHHKNGPVQKVKLIIYDILGRETAELVNQDLKPGTYEVEWDGRNFASGVYFYRIVAGEFTETKRMVLLK